MQHSGQVILDLVKFCGIAFLTIVLFHNPGGKPVARDFGAAVSLMFDGDSGGFVLGMKVIAIAACAVIATSGRRNFWKLS